MANNYKLRVYKASGYDKGNLDREEFFQTHEDMDKRYKELSKHLETYSLRPTAWEYKKDDWDRITGY